MDPNPTRPISNRTPLLDRIDVPADLPLLWVDAALIVTLLENLLQNAVMDAPPGAQIRLHARREGGVVQVVIDARGCRSSDGSGWSTGSATAPRPELGLAICRAIAVRHGGELQTAYDVAGGKRFEVSVPMVHRSPARQAAVA